LKPTLQSRSFLPPHAASAVPVIIHAAAKHIAMAFSNVISLVFIVPSTFRHSAKIGHAGRKLQMNQILYG
jgi:hypothetical protein